MSSSPDRPDTPPQILNSWQEIADHVGISVRSAQRAEAEDGLPVRRLRGRIVFADATELDQWKEQRNAPAGAPDSRAVIDQADERPAGRWHATQMARAVAIAASLIALLIGAAIGHEWNRVGAAVEFRLIGRTLEGVDGGGLTVWSYQFDTDVSSIRYPGETAIQVVDLDGDGEDEVLVPTRSAVDGVRVTISDALHCFTRNGTRKWTVRPDQTVTFGSQSFSAPWTLRDLTISPAPNRRIWIAFAHHTWWPGFVAEVTPSGAMRIGLVMDGRIDAVKYWHDTTRDYVIAAGVSYRTSEASIVFLDPHASAASFPNEGNPAFTCHDCPQNQPLRILSFPRTETGLDSSPFTWISQLKQEGNQLRATVNDYLDQSVAVLDGELTPIAMQLSLRRWDVHRNLERVGRLPHSVWECPERSTPRRVRDWTAASGWRERWVTVTDPAAPAEAVTQ